MKSRQAHFIFYALVASWGSFKMGLNHWSYVLPYGVCPSLWWPPRNECLTLVTACLGAQGGRFQSVLPQRPHLWGYLGNIVLFLLFWNADSYSSLSFFFNLSSISGQMPFIDFAFLLCSGFEAPVCILNTVPCCIFCSVKSWSAVFDHQNVTGLPLFQLSCSHSDFHYPLVDSDPSS